MRRYSNEYIRDCVESDDAQRSVRERFEMARERKEREEYKLGLLQDVQKKINGLKNSNIEVGGLSDGYHTFNELYFHRMILFAVICNLNQDKAWKSKLHADGTMFENYFIVGVETPQGQFTYHYHMEHWNHFDVMEVDYAPEWDGHMPKDVVRLLCLGDRK
ncbi:hypothetical protein NHG32_02480 [Aerococcaceae bacterium NML191219]|nr:hypothetical protein [Aerococcaceae bacterium NML191219]